MEGSRSPAVVIPPDALGGGLSWGLQRRGGEGKGEERKEGKGRGNIRVGILEAGGQQWLMGRMARNSGFKSLSPRPPFLNSPRRSESLRC